MIWSCHNLAGWGWAVSMEQAWSERERTPHRRRTESSRWASGMLVVCCEHPSGLLKWGGFADTNKSTRLDISRLPLPARETR